MTVLDFAASHGLLLAGVIMAGFAAGYAGGLFGIGGGIVTVPALYAVFQAVGVADGPSLKTAIGTSLAVIIVTSIRSLMTHHEAEQVDFSVLKAWAPWIAAGSAAGGFLAKWAPVELLTAIFAGGAFYIAWKRGIARPKRNISAPKYSLTAKRMKIPLGVGTGVFSALMGIGGGALGVMVMTMSGRSMHQAIGTSAGFGVAVAVPGVIGFIVSGWAADGLPGYSFGYVNGPAFALMAIMAGIGAPLGARLAHRVNAQLLSKLFAAYVFVAASALAADVFFN